MKKIITGIFLLSSTSLFAQPDAEMIIEKIDENMSSRNRIFTSKMIIHGRRGDRTIKAKTYSVGDDKAFTEYLYPAREEGTKMLKLEDQLWIYDPGTDRTIQIAGHMLRQSVMGSDLSYEDMMEDNRLLDHYNAEVTGSETIEGRETWVLELEAFDDEVTYQKRKMWIDKDRFIPLREELFAKSGKLLKRTSLYDVKRIEGRWFPTRIIFKDMLKQGDGTEYIFEEVEFNKDIPEYIFSKASLKR